MAAKEISLIAILCSCTPAQRTMAIASASSTLIAADWMQTRTFAKHPECGENNPIIGACGDRVPPDLYFPVTIALHLLVGYVLPADWRDIWFASIAGVQGATVWSNATE